MTSALDDLLAALHTTLKDPPQIVVAAQREAAALRAENTALRYHYGFRWDFDEQEYVGTVTEFPSLTCGAETRDGALDGIRKLVTDCIMDMMAKGQTPPKTGGER